MAGRGIFRAAFWANVPGETMTSGVAQDARADGNAKAHKSAGGHGRRQADIVVRAAAIHPMAEAWEESTRIFRAMAGRDGRIMLCGMGGSWLWSLRASVWPAPPG